MFSCSEQRYGNTRKYNVRKFESCGKNSQILLFFEIISVLLLFEKYLKMYNFLETRVWHETQVYNNRVY